MTTLRKSTGKRETYFNYKKVGNKVIEEETAYGSITSILYAHSQSWLGWNTGICDED